MRPNRPAITLTLGLAAMAFAVAACIPPRGTPPVLSTTTTSSSSTTTTLLTCPVHPASGVNSRTDTEDNDDFSEAQTLSLPSTFVGMEDNGPTPADNYDYASFNVPSAGVVSYDLPVGNPSETQARIVGPFPELNTIRGTATATLGCFSVPASATGTYYVQVRDIGGAAEQNYSVRVSFTATP